MLYKKTKKLANISRITKSKSNKKTKKLLTSHRSTSRYTSSSKQGVIIGCHASITPSILAGLQYARDIGANAAQIFLGSNRSASLKTKTKLSSEDIREIRYFLKQSRMILIIHSIYLLNLCKAPAASGQVKWMHANIWHDMKYGAKLGAKCVVLHLGSRMNIPIQDALDNLISNINHILATAPRGIKLSLETAAGAGTQVGYTLEELGVIWNGVKHHGAHRVGICIDTAHIFVAGEDISTPAGILNYFNRFNSLIGIRHITNLHLNDSRYSRGSRHDEHRGIGAGQIFNTTHGATALATLTRFAARYRIPMILETHGSARPGSEGTASGAHGYEWEINRVKHIAV